MRISDHSIPACKHDGLVIATNNPARFSLFISTEVTTQGRAAKFIVVGCGTDGSFQHDVQCRHNTPGFAVVLFPWLYEPGDFKIRNCETGQTGLGFCATTGCCFIPDFTT